MWKTLLCGKVSKHFGIIDDKVILFVFYNTVFLHFGKLVAKRAAFHVEIVGKLLTAVRDIEGKTTRFFDVFRKKRKKPLSDRFGHSV